MNKLQSDCGSLRSDTLCARQHLAHTEPPPAGPQAEPLSPGVRTGAGHHSRPGGKIIVKAAHLPSQDFMPVEYPGRRHCTGQTAAEDSTRSLGIVPQTLFSSADERHQQQAGTQPSFYREV